MIFFICLESIRFMQLPNLVWSLLKCNNIKSRNKTKLNLKSIAEYIHSRNYSSIHSSKYDLVFTPLVFLQKVWMVTCLKINTTIKEQGISYTLTTTKNYSSYNISCIMYEIALFCHLSFMWHKGLTEVWF